MEFREKNHSTRLVRTCDCPVDTHPVQAHNACGGGRVIPHFPYEPEGQAADPVLK